MSLPALPCAYSRLDPPAVLNALDAIGLRGDGRLLQLNSYENRVFQVHLEDGEVVVAKFYRPERWTDAQILEEHAFAQELVHADVPVVAPQPLRPTLAHGVTLLGQPSTLARVELDGDAHRVAVCDRHAGRAPELESPAVLRWLGRFLGRVHAAGSRAPFEHRRTLGPTWGHVAREFLIGRSGLLGPADEAAWRPRCDQALDLIDTAFERAAGVKTMRLHGDFHPGNVMWRDEGPHVVDLDDACNGPAVQDLWMLLSGDAASMREQLAWVLEGYRVFMPFDEHELALVEPLRTLRMIHHSAWIAERWSDPAFPIAFPWFGSAGYWSQQATQLAEQIDAMLDPARLAVN